MATPAKSPIPEGMHTITPSLWFNGNCKDAIAFYQKAFNAELMGPIAFDDSGEGVMHAMMRIGNSPMMLADAWTDDSEKGPEAFTTVGMWIYTEDCDALFSVAEQAGCEEIMPMMDCFWGDRMGKLKDPFGHCWAIATHKMIFTKEEIYQGMKEMEHSHKGCC